VADGRCSLPSICPPVRRWRDVVDRVLVADVAGAVTSALPMLEMTVRCRVNPTIAGGIDKFEHRRHRAGW
jgi:hypothetical protein